MQTDRVNVDKQRYGRSSVPDLKEMEESEKLLNFRKNHQTFSDIFAVKNFEEEQHRYQTLSP